MGEMSKFAMTLMRTLLLGSALLGASGAHAGIILGDVVDVGVYAPSRSEPCFLCGGITQVAVEAGDADTIEPYLAGGGWFEVNVDPTSISISFNRDISWQSGNFIGLVISDIDWLEGAVRAIPGATLSAMDANGLLPALTSMMNARLDFTDSSIALNWEGLAFSAGTRFDIALQGSGVPVQAPEPGVLLLLLTLLLLLAVRRFPRLRTVH